MKQIFLPRSYKEKIYNITLDSYDAVSDLNRSHTLTWDLNYIPTFEKPTMLILEGVSVEFDTGPARYSNLFRVCVPGFYGMHSYDSSKNGPSNVIFSGALTIGDTTVLRNELVNTSSVGLLLPAKTRLGMFTLDLQELDPLDPYLNDFNRLIYRLIAIELDE